MSLYYVTGGSIAQAADLNQALKELQQPSGGQEVGHYILAGPGYANNATISNYIPSISRHATPVSVTINTSDIANTTMNTATPITDHLTSSGFHVYDTSTNAQDNCVAGGLYTIQF